MATGTVLATTMENAMEVMILGVAVEIPEVKAARILVDVAVKVSQDSIEAVAHPKVQAEAAVVVEITEGSRAIITLEDDSILAASETWFDILHSLRLSYG